MNPESFVPFSVSVSCALTSTIHNIIVVVTFVTLRWLRKFIFRTKKITSRRSRGWSRKLTMSKSETHFLQFQEYAATLLRGLGEMKNLTYRLCIHISPILKKKSKFEANNLSFKVFHRSRRAIHCQCFSVSDRTSEENIFALNFDFVFKIGEVSGYSRHCRLGSRVLHLLKTSPWNLTLAYNRTWFLW